VFDRTEAIWPWAFLHWEVFWLLVSIFILFIVLFTFSISSWFRFGRMYVFRIYSLFYIFQNFHVYLFIMGLHVCGVYVCVMLGTKPRPSHMQGLCSTTKIEP
jgi:hypothetical protein